jgi:hypothetical protein
VKNMGRVWARCSSCGAAVELCPQEIKDVREGKPVYCSDECEAEQAATMEEGGAKDASR